MRLSAITPSPTSASFRDHLCSDSIEAMSALGDADASLAFGSPFLTVAEPALLLLAFALSAFSGAIGDEDALDAFCFRSFLIFVGMKAASAASRCGVRPRCDLGRLHCRSSKREVSKGRIGHSQAR